MLFRSLPPQEHRRLERLLTRVRLAAGAVALGLGTLPMESPSRTAQALGAALIACGLILCRLEIAVRSERHRSRVDLLAFLLDAAFTVLGLLLTITDPEWVASFVGAALILVAGIRLGRVGALLAMLVLVCAYLVGALLRSSLLGLDLRVDEVTGHLLLYGSIAWLTAVAVETTRRITGEPYFGPLRPVLDSAHDAFVALDPAGRVIEWSARARDLFGWSRREVLGREYASLIPERRRAAIEALRREFSTSTKLRDRQVTESEVIHKDGREIPVEIAVSRVEPSVGAPLYAFVRDIRERREMQRERARYLDQDALTALPSARLFHQRLLETHLAAAGEEPYALLLLDLDHFREVNAAFGHLAGDALLVAVARRLARGIPEDDVVARWSGDQFVVLLQHSGRFGAEEQATRILALFQEPFVAGGHTVELGVSIGISVHPEHGTEAPLLLGRADQALAAAKRLTNTFTFFARELEPPGPPRQLPLRADLRRAIRDGQLMLHYQPIVRLRGGAVEGLEALARWEHPSLGLISPDDFIGLAERTGLIRGLTEWALERAALDLTRWRATWPDLRVSVNLSARAFSDAAVSEHVEEISRRLAGQTPGLGIEITESMLLSEPERARERLDRWRAAGAHVAIDDFGTGFSSLVYLQQLNADAIKVDRQFVGAMTADPKSETIVRASIELGHELGFAVIAEGVEDARTWDLLMASGCDLAQGYHVGRPMAASVIPAWLTESAMARNPQLFTVKAGGSRGSVLVVEDDRAVLGLIGDVLEENGYRVDRAADGREALALAERGPDAVIIDMHLPVMSGAEVARALRKRGVSAPLIAMTAGPSAARFAEEIDAKAALPKPFDIEELVKVTHRVITGGV